MTGTPPISIALNWLPVLIDGKPFPWHRESPKDPGRELIWASRVYRWVFKDKSGEIKKAYIGQSGAFHDRIAGYRSIAKGSPTSGNDHLDDFKTWEDGGGIVELQFLDFSEFEINGQRINAKYLSDQEPRLFLENLAILSAKSEKITLFNKIPENVYLREMVAILAGLPTKEQKRLIELLTARLNKQS